MTRVVFMGTPAFAVPSLLALCGDHQVVGVVTQPDRRAGRGRKIVASPVKEAALERELEVFQPQSLRAPEAVQHLAQWQPDVIVVAAFGQILSAQVLDLAPHGSLNVHASLLPLYRGAAPIPAAILAGDLGTGVTIMRMDEGLDTGPILAKAELAILPSDTTSTLTDTLAVLGAQLLIETLPGWLAGRVPEHPQDPFLATYCRQLEKADGWLDWSQPAVRLDRQVRACDPWPGTYTTWQGQRLKVLRARALPAWAGEGQPGHVVAHRDGFGVATGHGLLEVLDVQLAGKKPVAAGPFVRGQRRLIDSTLGT
jgi:methionyl-tRNA formyltransferase